MKLGKTQIGVLKSLNEFKSGWVDGPYGPGWNWGTKSKTRRALDSLVIKGLAVKTECEWEPNGPKIYPQYTISEAGKSLLLGDVKTK